MNRIFPAILCSGLFCMIYACGNGNNTPAATDNSSKNTAAANYTKECSSCHGKAGNLMIGGAKDLTRSVISRDEAASIIGNGKGMMPPFRDKFSAAEIEELAAYAESLRK